MGRMGPMGLLGLMGGNRSYNHAVRIVRTVVLCLLAAPLFAQSSSFQVHGFLTGRAIAVKSQPSWLAGGVGRFDVGADNPDDRRTVEQAVAQLGIDWTPTGWLSFHADGLGRYEPSESLGKRYGVVQAFGDVFNDHWRFRVGSFWLPTSRENTDLMWNSPYTISYSVLNSWIGQEVRPVGADLQWSPNFYYTLGATGFRGNDTMGTELAARGWTLGNRLSVYNEELPLPNGRDTMAIGKDLDGNWGHSERIRIQMPERGMLQFTHVDNRAELVPNLSGYTPWQTRFNVLGTSAGQNTATKAAAEWMRGTTAVGFPGGHYTMDFETYYVLTSQKQGASTWTVRYERFSTRSDDKRENDAKKESGNALTIAWLRDMKKGIRTGLEYTRVEGDRSGLANQGFDPKGGGNTITFELRYGF